MIVFQDLTRQDLTDLLLPLGDPRKDEKGRLSQAKYRAVQIFHWVYQRHVLSWDEMSDLSKNVRAFLKENVRIFRPELATESDSEDGTRKFLWKLEDQKTVESVIIPAPEGDRLTACISSQVGCAMACKFCLTGIQGIDRNLKTYEIVSQILELRRRAPLTNIVFMGMGEPLNNLDSVKKACQIFLDSDGLKFSKRKVTVSTSGVVPGIESLGRDVDVSLAISLNASTNEQRDQIMPVNRRWNIESLLDACSKYPLGGHRRITFEYVLIRDFNDSLEDAARLIRWLAPIPHKINLIPMNEHSGSIFKRPSDETIKAFQHYLIQRGETATVRISRGRDILAACGQLRSLFGTARGTDRHKDFPQAQIS